MIEFISLSFSLAIIFVVFVFIYFKRKVEQKPKSFYSLKNKKFIAAGIEILQKNGDLLVFVRHPNAAGLRDFIYIKTETEFHQFLENSKPGESVALIKEIKKLRSGIISKDNIDDLIQDLEKPNHEDWLVIILKESTPLPEWFYSESKDELREDLFDYLGAEVLILEEPDGFSEEGTVHAYNGHVAAY